MRVVEVVSTHARRIEAFVKVTGEDGLDSVVVVRSVHGKSPLVGSRHPGP